MRDFLRWIAVLSCCMPAVAPCLAEDLVPWARDFDHARNQAAHQNKLVLIHFWSEACPPCRHLDRFVFTHPGVSRSISEAYVPVKINTVEQRELARQFGIRTIPTDVIITPDGQEVARKSSPLSVDAYIDLVEQVASNSQLLVKQPAQQYSTMARQVAAIEPSRPYDAQVSSYQPQPYSNSDSQRSSYGSSDPRAPRQDYYRDAGPNHDVGPNHRAPYSAGYSSGGDFNAARDYRREDPSRGQYAPPGITDRSPADRSPAAGREQFNRYATDPNDRQRDGAAPGGPRNNYDAGPAAHPSNDTPITNPYLQQNRLFAAPGDKSTVPSNDRGNPPAYAPPRADQHGGQFTPGSVRQSGSSGLDSRQSAGAGVSTGLPSRDVPSSSPGEYRPHGTEAPPVRPSYGVLPPPRHPSPAIGGNPPVAMEGFCPVSLVEGQRWVKGDVQWGAIHRGRTYLFENQEQQRKFLLNPDHYSPALSCYDPVRFVDQNELVEGKREHGVSFRGQMFLFTDEATLEAFWRNPARYAQSVQEAMRRNTAGNPRR